MSGMFKSVLVKKDGKLVHKEGGKPFKDFIAKLREGTTVHLFVEANEKESGFTQLAKVHKCIRELAAHTGSSFEDMKMVIKKKTGLILISNISIPSVFEEISFADCSVTDLGLAIQSCIEFGDQVGINLR